LLQNAYWLDDVLVFLAAAGLVVPLLHRARLGSILGFLIVGVIIGPYGLGRLQHTQPWIIWITIENPESVTPFADWGVVFLLFLIGLEISVGKLLPLARYVFGVGALQVALCTIALGVAAYLTGMRTAAAVILGLSLAQSSTAIVMQTLVEQGRTATHLGHVALAVLLFQDLMVVPTLFVTGMDHHVPFAWGMVGLTLAQGVVAIAGILLIGHFILRPLLHFVVKTGSRDLIMAITLLLVVGAAGATTIAGLSSAFGAFLAGLLLSESEYRHQIEVDLEPFKGLLLGLFFMTVGMLLDPVMLIGQARIILIGLAVLLAVKAAALYAASRAFRVPAPVAGELALLLAQGGEFALVTIALGQSVGVLTRDIANAATGIVVLSMMLTPLFGFAGRRLGVRLEGDFRRAHAPSATVDSADHVIIAGYGRVGQLIGQMFEAERLPYVALDLKGEVVQEHHEQHAHVFFGDAGRPEMLERAGARRARAFLITLRSPRNAERVARAILRLRPEAAVFARARDAAHARRLASLGVTAAVPESIDASLLLGGRVLNALRMNEEAVVHRVEAARQSELERLEKSASAGL
jgi:monovalent cation:H+ antiporter-2, CPA2 family